MQNRDLAETSGISSRRTDITTFFIGSGMASVAGVALTLIGSTSSTIGQSYLIDAFLVVVVGGLGQIKGTVIAAFALGLMNSFIEYSTTASLAKVIVFVIIVVFLQVRPPGLVHGADKEFGMTTLLGRWQTWALRRCRNRAVRCCAYDAVQLPAWPARAVSVLCDRRRRHRSRLGGPRRHAHPRPGRVLRAGRLHDGHASQDRRREIRKQPVPDFMQIAGIPALPSYWEPFSSAAFTIAAIVVIPTGIAALLGLGGVFKRRVKGAYFAILSQALAAALAILLVGQATVGGSNGLNGFFRTFFGFRLSDR